MIANTQLILGGGAVLKDLSSARAVTGLAIVIATSGCASHTIYNKVYEAGGVSGAEHTLPHTTVLGDRGVESQSGGRIASKCGEEGMAKVVVRRNLGQTLATLLTLGIVNPATISYQCQAGGADDPQPGDQDDL